MPALKTITLGCKVNQYETQYLREGLLRLGYRDAQEGETADLCVVNTCTVTAEGDLKSRKAIRQLARENPRAEIIVMGCYAARAESVVSALPGVVEVIRDKSQLPELLSRLGLVEAPTGISSFGRRHRAYVKVQDGCRMPCTYCIIPMVRTKLASRPAHQVLEEIRRLVDAGHREIVLTGIHLGHYGVDFGDVRTRSEPAPLARLVRRIAELDGEFRLRLSSLEAAELTPELLSLLAEYPDRICPHLHIPLQSGSDAVLRRMQRRWPIRRFIERCLAARETLDEPALTSDVIVGFPGETEADFEATCRAVQEVEFSKIHVFRFSPRAGTPAAEMPDQVHGTVKHRRASTLSEISGRLRRGFFTRLLGRQLQVLVESPSPKKADHLVGTSARYVPVELAGPEHLVGRLVPVRARQAVGERVLAETALCTGAN
jgi:threonylcarbamoyladenosine tRNA methylthiotransferase MtaB